MDPEQKKKFFDAIRKCTEKNKRLGTTEYLRAHKPSAKSLDVYRRLARNRINKNAMEGVTANSWHAVRAAVKMAAAERYKRARRACDEAQKAGDWVKVVGHLKEQVAALDAFEAAERAPKPETKAPVRSKRKTPRAEDWREKTFDAATPAQRMPVAVFWGYGIRPAELEKGIKLRREEGAVVATVQGAKVTSENGQQVREIWLKEHSSPGRAVLSIMGGRDEIEVSRRAKRSAKDLSSIRAKTGFDVSAYSFRHAFAADLKKQEGVEGAELIAAALGHASTRTQGRYGSVVKGNGGSVLAVNASRKIRSYRPSDHSPRPAP